MKVGQRVEEKYSGCQGIITLVQPGHILVLWDNGMQDICHVSYMKHIRLLNDPPEIHEFTIEAV